MPTTEFSDCPETRARIYQAYRAYFDLAERKRRWNIREDVPWDRCNKSIDPVIADVVQTFCMVELFLPDYLAKQLPPVRANRGRAWMLANWGYEESKHSMVLEDWLVRSGHRTEKQVAEIADGVLATEWKRAVRQAARSRHLHHVSRVSYAAALPESSTGRRRTRPSLGPRPGTRRNGRSGPRALLPLTGQHLLGGRPGGDASGVSTRWSAPSGCPPTVCSPTADGGRRRVRALGIFDERVFHTEVYQPLMQRLGLTRADLRQKKLVARRLRLPWAEPIIRWVAEGDMAPETAGQLTELAEYAVATGRGFYVWLIGRKAVSPPGGGTPSDGTRWWLRVFGLLGFGCGVALFGVAAVRLAQ